LAHSFFARFITNNDEPTDERTTESTICSRCCDHAGAEGWELNTFDELRNLI
jgi:hypothetical protein